MKCSSCGAEMWPNSGGMCKSCYGEEATRERLSCAMSTAMKKFAVLGGIAGVVAIPAFDKYTLLGLFPGSSYFFRPAFRGDCWRRCRGDDGLQA